MADLTTEEQVAKAQHIQDVTCMDLPLDWENVFYSDERARGIHTDSISDGLILSLSNLGKVDIEYISAVTGEPYKTVISALRGSIYQNPKTWNECFYLGWETAEEYLSGNLVRKLTEAKKANETYRGYFEANVEALQRVLPPGVSAGDIYVTLGSPWVPTDVIDDFILDLFGDPFRHKSGFFRTSMEKTYRVRHDEMTGIWEVPCKSRYGHKPMMWKTYGTQRMEALEILERALNMKVPIVTDEVYSPTAKSGKKRVINKEETLAATEKQKELIAAFRKWVWKDEDRVARLERIFSDKFGCVRRRLFDGSFLTFPAMSENVRLLPYQKDAVARILFTPNTLLAHDVGAGKTYVMIAAGQEKRRMQRGGKNLYVVPNNIVGQWNTLFMQMYPDAKVLCVEPKTFVPQKRQAVLTQIRDEDYDGIIMAYSCFEQIPLSVPYLVTELQARRDRLTEAVKRHGKTFPGVKKKIENLTKKMAELVVTPKDEQICFDSLGITGLFVDEAHNFKNVPFETNINRVLGLNSSGSASCKDMMSKVHYVQKTNNGGGVVLATGTPITNSVSDVFVLQQYLQSGELSLLDLQNFDAWVGMFAEKTTEFEIDVDTNSYRLATRFAKFHNLPELTAMLASFADFHAVDVSAGIPLHDGYCDVTLPQTQELTAYLAGISKRADDVRNRRVSRQDDNLLKITTDGRKAALDLRLVEAEASFSPQSKIAACVDRVAELYFQTAGDKSTQLIFCDTSTPKAGFNIYDDLKLHLTMRGIPAEQIAFIHSADTNARREKLFRQLRAGEIRILIGSTFKLGLGVNIQDKLIALHHLDVPWRPADMTQREGRILRQGNTNPKVYLYRYITTGSFDAYSWQLLETKQRFISDLLSGSLTDRSSEDIESTVLDYGEVKALAVGNPLVKQRVEAANNLSRYKLLQRKLVEARLQMQQELLELPAKIARQREVIAFCEEDAAFCRAWREANPPAEDYASRQAEAAQRKALRETLTEGLRTHILDAKETPLLSYRGFEIVIPANMTEEKPYLWLTRRGRYYVEMGDAAVGYLIRIDNFTEGMEDHLQRLRTNLSQMTERQTELETELSKGESYADRIEDCLRTIEALDKKLQPKKK